MKEIDIVLKTLGSSTEPMKAGEIAEATGLNKKDVDKAMKALKTDGRIVSPKYCYWTTA